MTTRNLFVQRDANGKAMRLGKQQVYVLTSLFDDDGFLRKGVAHSGWLRKVTYSLERREIIDHFLRFTDDKRVAVALTPFGLELRTKLKPAGRTVAAEMIADNRTVRQGAHIADSMRAKWMNAMGTRALKIGEQFSESHSNEYVGTVEAEVYRAIDLEFHELPEVTPVKRWLVALAMGGYYASKAAASAKEVE